VEWVALGSSGWQTEVGNTYGANDSPVNGGMPAFGGQLDDEQLAQVVLYERVAFGGEDLAEAELGCFAEGEDVTALGG
jgi:mono/diheme cytochrome c family protein